MADEKKPANRPSIRPSGTGGAAGKPGAPPAGKPGLPGAGTRPAAHGHKPGAGPGTARPAAPPARPHQHRPSTAPPPAGAHTRLPAPEPAPITEDLPEIDFDDLVTTSPVDMGRPAAPAGRQPAAGEAPPSAPGAARRPAPRRPSVPPPAPAAPGARRPSVPPPPPASAPPLPAVTAETEIAFLEEEIRAVDPADRRRAALLHMEIARLLEGSGAPPSKVEARVKLAAETCPELGLAQRALRRFLRRRKAWDDVLQSIDRELQAAGDAETRAVLLVLRGRVQRDALRRPDAAAEDFEKALALAPSDPSAVEALRVLHAAEGRWAGAAAALERAAAAADPARATELRREAALLREHALDEPQAALGLWELVLEASPAEPQALAAVERLYAGAGRWLDLCRTLVRLAETTPDPATRHAAYLRAGLLAAERLGDTPRAAEWLEAAARVRPDDPEPLDALAETYRRAGDAAAWEAALARRAALAATPAERAAFAVRRAHILADRLGRRSEAVALLRQAHADLPTDSAVTQALLALLGSEGQTAERTTLLLLEAERIAERAPRADALFRAGEACDRDPAAAAAARSAYERALEAVPEHRGAFDALQRLHERDGNWKALADLLARRVAVAADDAERRSLLRRLAAVREERLQDKDGALEALERLRELHPQDAAVLRDLQRLYAATGRWAEHAARLRAEAEQTAGADARAELLWRAGTVLEERLDDEAGARAAFEAAVQARSDHRPSLEALARLAARAGRWAEHLQYLDRTLPGLPGAEQAERWLDTARIAAERLGDEKDAVARCRRALEGHPGHPAALERLASLHERRREWRELAEVIAVLAAVEHDPARQAATRVRLGDLLAERLEQPAEAEAQYRAALSAVPGHEPAFLGLERVLLRAGDWAGLREVYRAAADAVPDGPARAPWLRKLAAVLAWRLQRRREALGVMDQLLAVAPDDPCALRDALLLRVADKQWREAADLLARLGAGSADPAVASACLKEEASLREAQLRQEAGDRLAAALERKPDDRETITLCAEAAPDSVSPAILLARQLAVTADPPERALLRLRLALAMQDAGEETALFGVADMAAREAPAFLPAVRLARQAAERQEDWPRAVQLLEQEGSPETTARPAARVEALLRAAELSAAKLGDTARARDLLQRAFDAGPADERVAAALGARLREDGDWSGLARILRRHAGALDPSRRTGALFELARVLRERLESPADAASALDELLAVNPRHPQALVMLGELRAAAESWQAAIEAFRDAERAMPERDAEWRRIRLLRCDILTGKLGQWPEAEQLLRDALGPDGRDPDFLRRLAEVLRRSENVAALEDTVARLVAVEPPARAAECWIDLARLARNRRDPARAAECFARAAALAVETPAALLAVQEFSLRDLGADEAVALLKDVLYRMPKAAQRKSGGLRALVGRLLAGQGRLMEAEAELREAVELLPDDVDARLTLAQVSGDNDEVRVNLLEAARRDPFRPEIYAGLARIANRDPRFAVWSTPACQILQAFGSANASQQLHAGQPAAPAGDKPLRRDQLLRWVVHPAEPRNALELLAAAGPRLGQLYPQPDYGSLEPLSHNHHAGAEVEAVAATFGFDRYDPFLTRRAGVTATFVLDDRVRVIVGPAFSPADRGLLRFYLGRVFGLLAAGHALVVLLPPGEVKRVMDGLAGQHVEGLGDPAMVQRVSKVLGWSTRRGLAAQARDYASPAPPDLSGWQPLATLTANRAGLVACGDFAAARVAVHAMAGSPAVPAEPAQAWDASRLLPAMADLLQFAVSQEYAAVRAQVL